MPAKFQNRAHIYRAQARAIRRTKDLGALSAEADALVEDGAGTLEELARRDERKAMQQQASTLLVLSDDASPAEVRQARWRQAVRLGTKVFLPSWRDTAFGLPNALVRSALFAVAKRSEGSREVVTDWPVDAQGLTGLKLAGYRLFDYDMQVFATVLSYYNKDRPLSSDEDPEWVTVSFLKFAVKMGVAYGANVHRAVRESLIRLDGARLRLRVNRRNIPLTRLVEVQFEDGSTGACTTSECPRGSDTVSFRVPEAMAELFGPDDWTAVPSSALRYRGLLRWLATFFKTHSKPHPLPVEALYAYSGARCELPEFRRRLKDALAKLGRPSTPPELRVACTQFDRETDEVTVYLERWNEHEKR